jgi:sugar phosphate permease
MLWGSIIISAGFILLGFEFSELKIIGIEIRPVVLLSAITFMMGLGTGISNPASDNACLGLMPSRASTITGVRGMFRYSGSAISIAIITLILQFIGNMPLGFTIVFISIGLILLLSIPFIFAMPDRDARACVGEK